MIGIYKISNNIDDRVYVGQSTNIHSRFKQHKTNLEKGKHDSLKLQNFYNSNKDSIVLEFEILEEVLDKDDLTRKEEKWIKTYNSMKNGFNTARVGCIVGHKEYVGEIGENKALNNPSIKKLKKSFADVGIKIHIESYDDSLLEFIDQIIKETDGFLLGNDILKFKNNLGAIVHKKHDVWGMTILFINEFEYNYDSEKYINEFSTHERIGYDNLIDFFKDLDSIFESNANMFLQKFKINKSKKISYRVDFPMYSHLVFYNTSVKNGGV